MNRRVSKQVEAYCVESGRRGHTWRTDECGDVDIFAYEGGGKYCNGPRCTTCGYGFCHHCQPLPGKACSAPKPGGTGDV